MEQRPAPDVTVRNVDALPTAVVAGTTTWREYPRVWRELSNEVWACLRAGGVQRGCPNVMLYLDDTPRVDRAELRTEVFWLLAAREAR
jgi:hypothetical protein